MATKTVFVTIFQGVEAKNILRTNIYQELIKNDWLRIVLFVDSKDRVNYYQKEFNHPRVVYEVAKLGEVKGIDKLFSILKFFTLKTDTTKLRRRMVLKDRGKSFKGYLNYFFGILLNTFLANKLARKFLRWLDFLLVKDETYKEYFDKHKPDLVFLSHLFDETEIHLLREAKKRGVKSIGFINSWDKLTARCSLRLLPNKLIIFNNIVKNEALQYADMKEKDIIVTGLPQYDIYVNRKPITREEFFEKLNLDPTKKLLVYAPMGKTFSAMDWDITDLLRQAIRHGDIKNAQLLLRFQPNDFLDEEKLRERPDLKYDWPGVRFSKKRGVNWDMSFEDIRHLHDTLYHLNVLVCFTSSISIDAAVFKKPVINIAFDTREIKTLSQSPSQYYGMTHYRNAIITGGISFSKSKEELIEQINKYLENPKLDQEGRQRLVREQTYKMDGKASERIAQTIINTLSS